MSIYTGVTNIAKKAKGYVGVGGVAKKLKSGYIGDANGIARKFFSSYQFPVKSGRYTSVDTQTVQIFTAQECIDAIAHGATKLKYKGLIKPLISVQHTRKIMDMVISVE